MNSTLNSIVATMGSEVDASANSITLFVLLLLVCVVIGHLLDKSRWMTELIVPLFIGLISGTIILLTTKGRSSHILVFNEELFFIYLLPPIIFNAGFQMKKKQFFKNFVAINLFGAIGTMISFAIISLGSMHLFKGLDIGVLELKDYIALGAVLSATDSVCTLQVIDQEETPHLYSLVFGEGVVNDATSVVLFHAIQRIDLSLITSATVLQFSRNFFGSFGASTFLGLTVGYFSGLIIEKLRLARHSADREIAVMFILAYLSHMLAELAGQSGILAVFFCGISMSHFTWPHVSDCSKVTSRHAFATFSYLAEIFIFLYVGMDALDIEKWKFASRSPRTLAGASGMLLGLVMLGRAAFVFPLSYLANLTKRSDDKISFNQQVLIWWAGLMRGAVSMALAYNQFTRSGHTQLQGNAILITCIIIIVVLTNVVGGLLSKPLSRRLLKHSDSSTDLESVHSNGSSAPLLSSGHGSEFNRDNGRRITCTCVCYQPSESEGGEERTNSNRSSHSSSRRVFSTTTEDYSPISIVSSTTTEDYSPISRVFSTTTEDYSLISRVSATITDEDTMI